MRLEEGDETPRYLGPSSGIAMTRLVMEEARRYTDSRSIRELVPEVTKRRTPVQSPGSNPDFQHNERKRSYPMMSAVPAVGRPSTLVRDKLIEVFNQKGESEPLHSGSLKLITSSTIPLPNATRAVLLQRLPRRL